MSSTTLPIHEFEQSFQAYIAERLPGTSSLDLAMQYSLLNGGKRIRPLFVLEASRLVNLSQPAALACAYALEIVHGFSLVHDDLPSMDNDDFRRGKPTTHRKFGEARALLAGDALLNFAHQAFFECASMVEPTAFFRAFRFFTDATHGMILGQSDELNIDRNQLDELLRIQSLKTGKLFEASVLCPLLLAGLTESDPLFQECQNFARNFGFAFQIADDIEDSEQDQLRGTKNILSHVGRDSAIRLATEKLTETEVSRQFSATVLLLSKLK